MPVNCGVTLFSVLFSDMYTSLCCPRTNSLWRNVSGVSIHHSNFICCPFFVSQLCLEWSLGWLLGMGLNVATLELLIEIYKVSEHRSEFQLRVYLCRYVLLSYSLYHVLSNSLSSDIMTHWRLLPVLWSVRYLIYKSVRPSPRSFHFVTR